MQSQTWLQNVYRICHIFLKLNVLVLMTVNNWIYFYYQVIWGGRWQDGSAASTGEEVEQINSHMSRCGNTTKYMLPESKCFATHGLLTWIGLFHIFSPFYHLAQVLRFMLHVLISCCHLSCPGTSSLLMHKHLRNLTDSFVTGFSFF